MSQDEPASHAERTPSAARPTLTAPTPAASGGAIGPSPYCCCRHFHVTIIPFVGTRPFFEGLAA
jgi:hypothetical protein